MVCNIIHDTRTETMEDGQYYSQLLNFPGSEIPNHIVILEVILCGKSNK